MTDALTKEALVAWVGTKASDEEYIFMSNECAFGQFLAAKGIKYRSIGGVMWQPAIGEPQNIPEDAIRPLSEKPHTFGALAERLRT